MDDNQNRTHVVPPAKNQSPAHNNMPVCPLKMLAMTIAARQPQPWPQHTTAGYTHNCIGEECAWCMTDVGPNGHRYLSCAIKHLAEHAGKS